MRRLVAVPGENMGLSIPDWASAVPEMTRSAIQAKAFDRRDARPE